LMVAFSIDTCISATASLRISGAGKQKRYYEN